MQQQEHLGSVLYLQKVSVTLSACARAAPVIAMGNSREEGLQETS